MSTMDGSDDRLQNRRFVYTEYPSQTAYHNSYHAIPEHYPGLHHPYSSSHSSSVPINHVTAFGDNVSRPSVPTSLAAKDTVRNASTDQNRRKTQAVDTFNLPNVTNNNATAMTSAGSTVSSSYETKRISGYNQFSYQLKNGPLNNSSAYVRYQLSPSKLFPNQPHNLPYIHQYPPQINSWSSNKFDLVGSQPYHLPQMISSSAVMTAPPPAVDYVTDLGPHDVLSGRGGATNSYRGNRAFRTLVKDYQDRYLRAKKRDKPAVASMIVETVRQRGGRFLRRENNHLLCHQNRLSGDTLGTCSSGYMIYWVDIGDDRAREKTCQALREGAPEIRRQGHRSVGQRRDGYWNLDKLHSRTDSRSLSFSDEFDGDTASQDKGSTSSDANFNEVVHQRSDDNRYSESNLGRTYKKEKNDSDLDDQTPEVRNGGGERNTIRRFHLEDLYQHEISGVPIYIRPWERLLPDRSPIEVIGLDQLSTEDRNYYLQDFDPPSATNDMFDQQNKKIAHSRQSVAHSNSDKNDSVLHKMPGDIENDFKSEYGAEKISKRNFKSTGSIRAGPSQWSLLTA